MESYGIPQGGYQLPVQRRLSRLYNDTKKSSDFVKEPVQNAEDPDVKSLHRKLKIQNDRLVTWGLEWSDPSQQDIIDDSLSKAGLSEVVGSIMSTIKEILAEAEPLWASSRRQAGALPPLGDKKIPIVAWDKARFEDLVRDLTTSIDTLYDLSRTRSNAASSARARPYQGASTEDLRAFESTRMQTPQQVNPQTLTSLRDRQPIPMSETTPDVHTRDIVYMSKQAYSDLTRNNGRPYTALLLEHAEFDPMYSATGIMPDMSRFEKLSAGLQTEPQRSPGSWTGLPQLLGYFEDMDNSRLGLVYHFPPGFNPINYEPLTHNTLNTLCSLSDLLSRPDFEPTLEAKFRLAYNLANTVFDMHARGITHGNLTNSSISFCKAVGVEPGMGAGEVDIRRPLISSFDLFPESFQEGSTPTTSIYRHPLDPKTTAQQSLLSNPDSKAFDVYSLGMLLLSIGMWTNLENLVSSPSATSVPEVVLEQLAKNCGTLYMKAVQTCWKAVDEELAAGTESSQVMTRVQVSASRYLEVCAILDSVGGLEDRLSSDLGIQSSSKQAEAQQKSDKTIASSSKDAKAREAGFAPAIPQTTVSKSPAGSAPPETQSQRGMPSSIHIQLRMLTDQAAPAPTESRAKRSTKSRLYPHTPLPPEAVEHWNAVLMPQINQALRHFYRKNPESVEISLESIGETAKETTPTVLVVCTSVSKVKAILRRKMGALFDGTTGYALKVCRGQVLRSRNQGTKRSVAHPESAEQGEVVAANGSFQERPLNGASIGAWIGDRHLPPVSFGGLVVVDEKTYGMTVHHMLDDPEASAPKGPQQPLRSGAGSENQVPDLAAWYAQQYPDEDSPNSGSSSDTEDFAAEFSDDGSDDAFTESAVTSEYSDEESEADQYGETGDIPGVEPGCGDGYVISQPALDDVEEGFFASPDTQDEEHLDSFGLGEVFASSGIRRRHDDRGLVHEIDWALFEFKDDRLPQDNAIPVADSTVLQPIHPTSVVPASSLPNLEVQCMARTSGLQTGVILPTLVSVKIYGRTSPSHTYQITSSPASERATSDKPWLPLGLPGDSGAWIIERNNGQVCGHVLAWSNRKRVAYICPMDVLLLDIAETLEATEVRLPGGEPVVKMVDDSVSINVSERDEGYCEPQGDESDLDAELRSMAAAKRRSLMKGKGSLRMSAQDIVKEGGADRTSSVRSMPPNRSSALGEIEQDLSRLSLGNKEAEAGFWRA